MWWPLSANKAFNWTSTALPPINLILYDMKFTKIEESILKWIAKESESENLREQLSNCTLIGRDYTGVGFFLKLKVSDNVPVVEGEEGDIDPVPGPFIDSPELESGGDTVLFIHNGVIETLEIFAYGDSFPESLEEYELQKPNRSKIV